MKTVVNFLIEQDHALALPGVFAFFPNDQYANDSKVKTCYSHIGQHSACCIEYAKECRQATNKEHEGLMAELESIGYELDIQDFNL